MALQNRAKATREAIIAGAASVFEEHGYGNASVNMMSEAAQVTKGALYFHFKSKEDLAVAVIEEQHRIVVGDIEAMLAHDRSALANMVLACRVFASQMVTEPVVRAGIRLTLEAPGFGQPVRCPFEEWICRMEDLATRAAQERQIRPSIDPAHLARYIVASFTGVQMVSRLLTEHADLLDRMEEMWSVLLPSIMHEEFHPDPCSLSGLASPDLSMAGALEAAARV
jgi:AcrR family transcriptional regulator